MWKQGLVSHGRDHLMGIKCKTKDGNCKTSLLNGKIVLATKSTAIYTYCVSNSDIYLCLLTHFKEKRCIMLAIA